MLINRIMKKILVVILCLACVSSYAQKRKRKPAAKANQPAVQTTPQQQPAQTPPAGSTTTSAIPGVGGAADTSRKGNAKPFEAPLDGYYKKTNILSATVTPYPALRENDVAFQKRIWREIDIRDKMNTYLASPKKRLIEG